MDAEKAAAMAWTRLAEGEDAAAVRIVRAVGYQEALRLVESASRSEKTVLAAHGIDPARWIGRLDHSQFEKDRDIGESLGGFVWPGDPLWPERVDYLGDTAPLGLWYRGKIEVLGRQQPRASESRNAALALVGSRAASTYGVRIASSFASEVAEEGVIVISGGAFGIDAAAHRGALAVGGKTAAVFAGGIDRPYPVAHAALFRDVLDTGGVLLSESPPGAAPLRHRFLARNRIIAALADATVVIEASYRSGALSTARHAFAIARSVGAVPGPVTSPNSIGCHRLLREGATCVTSAAEALELIMPLKSDKSTGVQLSLGVSGTAWDAVASDPLLARVYDALPTRTSANFDALVRSSGLSPRDLHKGLGKLQAMNLARNMDGRWRRVPAA